MTPPARLAAAVEVLADIVERRRPAPDALKDWGLAHRFAGSGDRAAIASLVYDALRRRSSSAWIMAADTPRAVLLGMLKRERKLDADAVARLLDGSRFALPALTHDEVEALRTRDLSEAPPHVVGDYPEWLDASLAAVFGEARVEEGAALAARAPLDLRVNTLRGARDAVLAELGEYAPTPTPWSPWGLRIPLPPDGKAPAMQSEPAFLKGQVEIQDEGSQLAALLTGARAGQQVVDLCAGAGGKTLALAALTENEGHIDATDPDKRRLAPIHARLERAGVRNVEVRTPRRETDVLADLAGRVDLAVVDAPCTGTGAWRRNPDAKWRVRPGALAQRTREQTQALDRAAALVRPGGRVAYITCSVLDEENGAQVRAFLSRRPAFSVVQTERAAACLGDSAPAFLGAALNSAEGILMTPRRTGTDGFFVSLLERGA